MSSLMQEILFETNEFIVGFIADDSSHLIMKLS